MKTTLFVTMILLASLALAADAPKDKPAEKPPAVTPELRAKFWKAEATLAQARAAMQQANDGMTAAQKEETDAVADLRTFCGEKFQPAIDSQPHADGAKPTMEPVCIEKPPAPPAAAEKK